MRTLLLGLVTLALTLSGAAYAFESKTDRPGGDYTSFDINPGIVGPAAICESRCKSERRCVAWTAVDPGIQGPRARCWLKNSIPEPRPCPHCTSGAFKHRNIQNSF